MMIMIIMIIIIIIMIIVIIIIIIKTIFITMIRRGPGMPPGARNQGRPLPNLVPQGGARTGRPPGRNQS